VKHVLRVAAGDPDRLVAVLAARLTLEPESAAALVRRGAVELDGQRVRDDRPVRVGVRVIAFLPEAPVAVPTPLVVAYRDDHVFVIDKPAGLRSQAARAEAEDTLIARVQRELDPGASLLHRLDRETSGLVLLPRTDVARVRLQRAFDEGAIDRRYLARVYGRLDAPRTIDLRIGVDPRDRRRRIAHPARSDAGESAVTHVEPLDASDAESRLRLRLETGRTHQLRVHLSAIGHPIVGDTLYGAAPAERLWLHADELTFVDQTSGARRTVRSALPFWH
jgi:23S rRNA pseudouridine1911/1915/1917 synthase